MTPPGASWLHRLGAGQKLAGLAVAGTALLGVGEPSLLLGGLLAVGALYRAARVPARTAWAQLRPAALLLLSVFALQGFVDGWQNAVAAVLRFGTLILLASLVSLTTPATAVMQAFERGLAPLARLGVRPRATALGLSLALRFLPLLAERARQVRDAQRARGAERNPLALAVPLVVQSLKMAHELAEAIEARGFDPDQP